MCSQATETDFLEHISKADFLKCFGDDRIRCKKFHLGLFRISVDQNFHFDSYFFVYRINPGNFGTHFVRRKNYAFVQMQFDSGFGSPSTVIYISDGDKMIAEK